MLAPPWGGRVGMLNVLVVCLLLTALRVNPQRCTEDAHMNLLLGAGYHCCVFGYPSSATINCWCLSWPMLDCYHQVSHRRFGRADCKSCSLSTHNMYVARPATRHTITQQQAWPCSYTTLGWLRCSDLSLDGNGVKNVVLQARWFRSASNARSNKWCNGNQITVIAREQG